jgi:hypothetical protein
VRARREPVAAPAPDLVWAASSNLRVLRGGRVLARIDLGRTVFDFAQDDGAVLAATSGGLYAYSADGRDGRRLTGSPARQVEALGGRIWVLEHDVAPGPDRVPVPSAYRLREIDRQTSSTLRSVEVGDRVLAFAPPFAGRALLVHESGAVRAMAWPEGTFEPIEPPGGGRFRQFVALSPQGERAYMAVEGSASAVVEWDVATMRARTIPLGRATPIRGLALGADAIWVDALRAVARVPLPAGSPTWADLDAPHQGAAISRDGRRLWLARPVDGDGGSVTCLDARTLRTIERMALTDVGPWIVGVP